MGFAPGTTVVVEQVDDHDWLTRALIHYTGRTDTFTVPQSSPTDFASVPRVFVWFLPRYGRYTKAAVLHDYLWRECAANGKMPWREADGIFRRAMRELDVPFLRRWIMWSAVRVASLRHRSAWAGWWRDAPRVVLFGVIAAPVVLPPAAVILAALLVWFVVEAVVWVPLKLAQATIRRARPRQPPKQVNRPGLDWRT